MILNLFLSVVLTIIVVTVHLLGLFTLLHFLRRNAHHAAGVGTRRLLRQGAMMLAVVLGIFLVHTFEIWIYAVAYLAIGAFSDFPTALYFSTTAFSTIGFGDIILSSEWRLFGSIEGVTGLILIGWSSAFLLSVTSRLRALEHNWEVPVGNPARAQKKKKK